MYLFSFWIRYITKMKKKLLKYYRFNHGLITVEHINFWRGYILCFTTFLWVYYAKIGAPNVYFQVQNMESNFINNIKSYRKNTNTCTNKNAPDNMFFIFSHHIFSFIQIISPPNHQTIHPKVNMHHNKSMHKNYFKICKLSLPICSHKLKSL